MARSSGKIPPAGARKAHISSGFDLNGLAQPSRVYTNLSVQVIAITEDKLDIWVRDHVDRCENRRCWHGPLALVVTFAISLGGVNYQDIGTTKTALFLGFYVLGLILSFLWLLRTAYTAYKSPTREEVIALLKKEVVELNPSQATGIPTHLIAENSLDSVTLEAISRPEEAS